jgi:DNA-binding Xre family transcriptional regulator
MEWNLRMVAAQRGIWRSTELRRALADAGLQISAGKMSHLWSGTPISIRLEDLEVICSVLHCQPSELLLRADPTKAVQKAEAVKAAEVSRSVQPSRRRGGRSQPPA